jgi:hypothetical protein
MVESLTEVKLKFDSERFRGMFRVGRSGFGVSGLRVRSCMLQVTSCMLQVLRIEVSSLMPDRPLRQ